MTEPSQTTEYQIIRPDGTTYQFANGTDWTSDEAEVERATSELCSAYNDTGALGQILTVDSRVVTVTVSDSALLRTVDQDGTANEVQS